jgi:hypothetical protein
MARDATLASRILGQDYTACGKSADVAIARLEFDLTRERDYQLRAPADCANPPHACPIYPYRAHFELGGLMAYASSSVD